MFVVDGTNSPITIYGLLNLNATGVGNDAGETDPYNDTGEGFMKLNKYLTIDEDVGSGQVAREGGNPNAQEVSPWFTVPDSIPPKFRGQSPLRRL